MREVLGSETSGLDGFGHAIQQSFSEVLTALQPTKKSGVAVSLRDKSGKALVDPSLLGSVKDSDSREKYLKFAPEKTDRLCRMHLVEGHLLSRQSRNPDNDEFGGAVVADRYVLAVSGLPELADESVCLLTAIRMNWITVAEAVQMASISDEENPFGNTFFLEKILPLATV